jgi:DNA repair protein RadC
MYRQKIKEWAESERPRERLEEKGASAISDTELIAILLNTGSTKKDVIEIAREVLTLAKNDLKNLPSLSIEELSTIQGVGKGKAIKLLAAFELSRRYNLPGDEIFSPIDTTRKAAEFAIPMLRNLKHEECWVIFLNQANCVISKEKVSSGGVSGTVVDIRLVLRSAISKLASGLILIHNHPSGQLNPGVQDREQTMLLREAAALFNIRLLDHLIIAGNKYYSFAESGSI